MDNYGYQDILDNAPKPSDEQLDKVQDVVTNIEGAKNTTILKLIETLRKDIKAKQDALTGEQLLAVNSGVDSGKVLQIQINADDIATLKGIKYGASLVASIDTSTFVLSFTLKDQDGNTLGSTQTIDLPLESVVVNGSYDSANKALILTLQNGNTITIPVSDLISGLQPLINADNKLNADYLENGATVRLFYAWDSVKLNNIENFAQKNVQANWNETDNTKDDYIKNKPTIPVVNDATITIQQNGVDIDSFTLNGSTNKTININVPNQATEVFINNVSQTRLDFDSDPQTQITANASAISGKQPTIDSGHKLSADLVDDTSTTNKFVTASDKSTWNAKQNALSATQLNAVNSGIDTTKVGQIATNTTNIANKADKNGDNITKYDFLGNLGMHGVSAILSTTSTGAGNKSTNSMNSYSFILFEARFNNDPTRFLLVSNARWKNLSNPNYTIMSGWGPTSEFIAFRYVDDTHINVADSRSCNYLYIYGIA